MEDFKKFAQAISNLKDSAECSFTGNYPMTEEKFITIDWITGKAENGTAITTKTNPHSELTWEKVNTEMARLQTEYDANEYARKRKDEYPTIEELVVALYDTDDKAAIEAKRAEVKAKYPKS
jgi:hypothetical protein